MAQVKQISRITALKLLVTRKSLQVLEAIEKKLRNEIAGSFKDEEGVYEEERINIDGVEVHKFYSGINTPKLDNAKAWELVKAAKIKGLAVKKTESIDPAGLKLALEQGKITLEQYNACFSYKPVMNIKINDLREKQALTAETETEVNKEVQTA